MKLLPSPNTVYPSYRNYPHVVTIKQMCEILGGIEPKAAYHLLRENAIPHIKIGQTYHIPKQNILAYVQADGHSAEAG